MTRMPLVSVVVPVYNYEQYVGECIESVLTQTYSNWELVVVNNIPTATTINANAHVHFIEETLFSGR